MMRCDACSQDLGMNIRCPACVRHLLREGGIRLHREGSAAVLKAADAWMDGDGREAPETLRRRVGILADFLRDAGPSTAAADLAYALHYVVLPFDLVPDSTPHSGWMDDEAVMGVAFDTWRDLLEAWGLRKGLDTRDFR